jgi:hypothetical protein
MGMLQIPFQLVTCNLFHARQREHMETTEGVGATYDPAINGRYQWNVAVRMTIIKLTLGSSKNNGIKHYWNTKAKENFENPPFL